MPAVYTHISATKEANQAMPRPLL